MMGYTDFLRTMREEYKRLSGFEADDAGDIGIRLKVLAARLAGFEEELEALERQILPQNSTGEYLDMHAEIKGIFRKPATRAEGELRFYRETPALSELIIPQGTVCTTSPEPAGQFVTTCGGILPAGLTEALVPARAVEPGMLGNVAPGSVCLMVTPVVGMAGVENPLGFCGGTDAEGDEELRERLLQSFRNISNGTNRAFYYDFAMSHPGVSSARVLPRRRGRGTVDVVIGCAASDPEAAARELQEELSRKKEINVDVRVSAAEKRTVPLEAEIAVREGYDPALVESRCRERLLERLGRMEVGEGLLLAELGQVLYSVDGVYNYRILKPGADLPVAPDELAAAGEIAVRGMEVVG